MVEKEIICSLNSEVTEEDRISQRMVYFALVNNDLDELKVAFEYIYNLYHDHLHSLALTKVNNREDAEDVVLDAFTALFDGIMERRKIGHIKGYLYKLFFWKCMDYNLARKRFHHAYSLTDEIDNFAEYSTFIHEIELAELLKKVLEPQEIYIFVHYAINGEPLAEIKQKLKLKHVDIFKYYKKIVNKLKKGADEYYGTKI